MNRVYIKTYGCQMNERDSEAVAALLRKRGYSMVDDEKNADVVLINTCSVRDLPEQKAIGKAGHLSRRKRKNPNFIVGIMGCMAQNRGASLLDRLPDLDLVVGTQKFHRVPDHLDHLIASMEAQGPKPQSIIDLEEEAGSESTIRDHFLPDNKPSAFVSIMQGCNMNCTFCNVPQNRGGERSRSIEEIMEEVQELALKGVKEVTLLGQIVTSYGRRQFPFRDGKSPFVQLLERIEDTKGIERIRFTSPHPRGFKQDLIEAYGSLSKLCEYIHFPLQSGSNKILKAMNRPYSSERFLSIVEALKARVPDMYFSTDIIVGFPGETDEDFLETKTIFEEIGFDMAFIFKYSTRPNTKAALMEDQISDEVKAQRNQVLLDVLQRSSIRRNESLVGTVQEVLVEGKAKRGEDHFFGRTRGYRKVIFKGNERLIGNILKVKVTDCSVSSLMGEIELTG